MPKHRKKKRFFNLVIFHCITVVECCEFWSIKKKVKCRNW